MLKKETTELVEYIKGVENDIEKIRKTHLKEYSEYGMDDIANDLISIQTSLEIVRHKVQYAIMESEWYAL